MVPPDDLFGAVPVWVGVYLITAFALGLFGWILYRRVLRLVLLGRRPDRFDQPLRRAAGAIPPVFGQLKVLQSVSLKRDRAGLSHFFIFWGFISFAISYVIFIFGDSAWRPFSSALLTDVGVRVYSSYLDVLAVVFLAVLAWAALRRWVARPRRLSFDLTQGGEPAIILAFIALLMLLMLLTEAFYVVAGGEGPAAQAVIGRAIGSLIGDTGMSQGIANGLQGFFWWLHLGVILAFAIYVPLSKHMHIVSAPFNLFLRPMEPMGTLSTPGDLETAERFGASRIQDFT